MIFSERHFVFQETQIFSTNGSILLSEYWSRGDWLLEMAWACMDDCHAIVP